MSDPREVIFRTVIAPPPESSSGRLLPTPATRLIGKAHGRMRCINLSLTADARQALYAMARRDSITLGEALMDVLDTSVDNVLASRRPGRATAARRGVVVTPVYVLLTPAEAANLAAVASRSQRSISDFASRILVS